MFAESQLFSSDESARNGSSNGINNNSRIIRRESHTPSAAVTAANNADFEFMLQPLETHFEDVGKYLAAVISFLKFALKDLNSWNSERTDNVILLMRTADAISDIASRQSSSEVNALELLLNCQEKLVNSCIDITGGDALGGRAAVDYDAVDSKKVKIVNAVLASTKDLVTALKGLVVVIGHIRSQREVAMGQAMSL